MQDPAVPAAFRDFSFKLLVIEQLMHEDEDEDEKLTPAFSIDECPRAEGITGPQLYAFDNDLAYTVLDGLRLLPAQVPDHRRRGLRDRHPVQGGDPRRPGHRFRLRHRHRQGTWTRLRQPWRRWRGVR
ncbi:hypothetical protein ACUN29_21025 [Streptomyces sp. WC2508]|uniref:hypothetical protein n=1 Tax=Streptomyces sp. WC2508 TaxID=3461405 RepID=UPI004043DE2B